MNQLNIYRIYLQKQQMLSLSNAITAPVIQVNGAMQFPLTAELSAHVRKTPGLLVCNIQLYFQLFKHWSCAFC